MLLVIVAEGRGFVGGFAAFESGNSHGPVNIEGVATMSPALLDAETIYILQTPPENCGSPSF